MATSQRVSRGFHRLGIFLAALPLIAGIAVTLFFAKSAGDSVPVDQKLACANQYIARAVESLAPTPIIGDSPG